MRLLPSDQTAAQEFRRHLSAAAVWLLLGAIVTIFLAIDRVPPVTFLGGSIQPQEAVPGEKVEVDLKARYDRLCDGEVSRDIVGSDGIIHTYRKHFANTPIDRGVQEIEKSFKLPRSIPAGPATYQARMVFDDGCGITTKLFPIVVYAPKLSFQVKATPDNPSPPIETPPD